MSNAGTGESRKNFLYSLISLDDFKAIAGVDDRDDKLSRFCLMASTKAIEHYCMRQLLRRYHYQFFTLPDTTYFELEQYPVRKIVSSYTEQHQPFQKTIINPKEYYFSPDFDNDEDIPHTVVFRKPIPFVHKKTSLMIRYLAGYSKDKTPADLAAACLELAAWNMNRYRGRRIGKTRYVRGRSDDDEIFELVMPENVKALVEPYRRKTI